MLRKSLNISWKDHVTNEELCGTLPQITEKIHTRRLRLAGHCVRHPEEVASRLVLWTPDRVKRKQGRPSCTYVDTLKRDTGLECEELDACMNDRIQ